MIRHDVVVAVPTRLTVERKANRLGIAFDLASAEAVKITLGDRMTMGEKYELRIGVEGEARPVEANGGTGMTSPVNPSDPGVFNGGRAFVSHAQSAIPVKGKNYVIEEDITIFETDIPTQHFWSPTSGKYSVLWEGKLQSISAGE